MRAAGKSRRHHWTKCDNGGDKALPQTSNIGSDKRHKDGGQEVAREYAAENTWQQWTTMADKSFQGWPTESRSSDKRQWQEKAEMVE